MTRTAIEEHLANPNKPQLENKLHLPAEDNAQTNHNESQIHARLNRAQSNVSDIDSSSACLKTNKTPRAPDYYYNPYGSQNNLNTSIPMQHQRPEMVIEYEDAREARQHRVMRINATMQRVAQRNNDPNSLR